LKTLAREYIPLPVVMWWIVLFWEGGGTKEESSNSTFRELLFFMSEYTILAKHTNTPYSIHHEMAYK
jgi:hypothetical protein